MSELKEIVRWTGEGFVFSHSLKQNGHWREAAEAGWKGKRRENISVSFDTEKVVGLGDSRHTSTSDCWSRKMRLLVFTEYWVSFFRVKKGMTKHPGSSEERNLFSVKKHTSQSCKASQD